MEDKIRDAALQKRVKETIEHQKMNEQELAKASKDIITE